jgi:hypothetical protein
MNSGDGKSRTMKAGALGRWIDATVLDLGRQFRWSYFPPLMVYLAAGVSGLTAVVGTFVVKDYLGLSAAFLAGLAFWAGIPWALKMPLGHLVDLMWRWKASLVYLGAALIAISMAIMYALIAHPAAMAEVMSIESWYVLSALLAPTGYVVQDIVADAMTVEAVPLVDARGHPFAESDIKVMHTTMQTLGRFAIITGFTAVAALNIAMFSGVETMSAAETATVYADIYLLALTIPVISVAGVILGSATLRFRSRLLRRQASTTIASTACCLLQRKRQSRTGRYSAAPLSSLHSSWSWDSARFRLHRRSSSWGRWRSYCS